MSKLIRALGRKLIAPGWAVIDQGAFAISNFALTLLLARWLTPYEYGMFSVAYTALLLIATFHTAILTEPMLVFGAGKYNSRLSHYLDAIALAHWLIMGIVTIVTSGIGVFLWFGGRYLEARTVWVLALASPFILFSWLARRACYVRMMPSLAGYAGGIYLLLMVVHIIFIHQIELISVPMAFVVLGSASLVSGLWLTRRLRMKLPAIKRNDLWNHAAADHWSYGRWSMMTGVLIWIPGQVVYFVLPMWGGLDESAGLRALGNLVMPYTLLCTAFGTILTTSLVRARGDSYFHSLLAKYLFFLVGGGILYWLCISLASSKLIGWMYDGQYLEYADLVWVLGGLPIFSGVIAVFGGALRSLQQPDSIFWSYVSSSAVALTIGLWFIAAWGITGAVFAVTFSYAISASVMIVLYLKIPASPLKEGESEVAWA